MRPRFSSVAWGRWSCSIAGPSDGATGRPPVVEAALAVSWGMSIPNRRHPPAFDASRHAPRAGSLTRCESCRSHLREDLLIHPVTRHFQSERGSPRRPPPGGAAIPSPDRGGYQPARGRRCPRVPARRGRRHRRGAGPGRDNPDAVAAVWSVVAARVAIHRGELAEARRQMATFQMARIALGPATGWLSVRSLLEGARGRTWRSRIPQAHARASSRSRTSWCSARASASSPTRPRSSRPHPEPAPGPGRDLDARHRPRCVCFGSCRPT